MLTLAEENYLKAIYHLAEQSEQNVSTNAIAEELNTKAASVTDMIKRLSGKGILSYQKYRGVQVSETGKLAALRVIRKHRLWETFLVAKLKFNWDEVHEVAEQLEHIQSPLLIKRLDELLGHPKFDPHGDPIPDENGEFKEKEKRPLFELEIDSAGLVVTVQDDSPNFLQYLDKIGIYIGAKIRVTDKVEFDGSMEIQIDSKKTIFISKQVSENIWVSD